MAHGASVLLIGADVDQNTTLLYLKLLLPDGSVDDIWLYEWELKSELEPAGDWR